MAIKKIEIDKILGLDELDKRLRSVSLKGFPDVKIYEHADIEIKAFSPDYIVKNIFTPQPSVYRKGYLDRVEDMASMFADKGINIFRLNGGVDYTATDENGERTSWTLIPPVLEVITVDFGENGPDYSNHIDPHLREAMERDGHKLNPDLKNLSFKEYLRGRRDVQIICDGSHRVHVGIERGIEQHLLMINAPKVGFPYYAAPKPYSAVHVLPERPVGGGGDKTHVLTEPGHKLLYRLFPSGGILNGSVRP